MARVNSTVYNASSSPYIEENIVKIPKNILAIRNASYKLNFLNEFTMNDPRVLAKDIYRILESNKKSTNNRRIFYQRPEVVSEFVYHTPDLWYIVMMANNSMDHRKFAINENSLIYYYAPEIINNYIKYIESKMKIRKNKLYEIYDRTLKDIDF
jgi:hypothetical protein